MCPVSNRTAAWPAAVKHAVITASRSPREQNGRVSLGIRAPSLGLCSGVYDPTLVKARNKYWYCDGSGYCGPRRLHLVRRRSSLLISWGRIQIRDAEAPVDDLALHL